MKSFNIKKKLKRKKYHKDFTKRRNKVRAEMRQLANGTIDELETDFTPRRKFITKEV